MHPRVTRILQKVAIFIVNKASSKAFNQPARSKLFSIFKRHLWLFQPCSGPILAYQRSSSRCRCSNISKRGWRHQERLPRLISWVHFLVTAVWWNQRPKQDPPVHTLADRYLCPSQFQHQKNQIVLFFVKVKESCVYKSVRHAFQTSKSV